ncbi:hypothetical protein GCM10009780_02950 [Actinomadura alba]
MAAAVADQPDALPVRRRPGTPALRTVRASSTPATRVTGGTADRGGSGDERLQRDSSEGFGAGRNDNGGEREMRD